MPSLCDIVHSSQTMKLHFLINSAAGELLEILQIAITSSVKSSGNLNIEWVVFPWPKRVAAIPEDATARAT